MLPTRAKLALLLTGAGLAFLLNFKTPGPPVAISATGSGSATGGIATTAGSGGSTTGSSTSSAGSSGSSAAAKSGTYTGSAVQTRYGTVQIQLTIANGRITAVQALQYPSDNPRSSSINQSAIPTLVQEVLQAQSPNVNTVSGATYTSQGFMQSLEYALTQANAA